MDQPLLNFLLSLLDRVSLSSLSLSRSRFLSQEHTCWVLMKLFSPGSNWSVWHPSLEDWHHGHHTQSHGVGAIQVNRDLWMGIMIRVDHSVYRVYLQLIINGCMAFQYHRILMLMYWRYGEFIVENVDLQSAPLLFLGGNRAHQGWLGPRLLCHVLRNPR